MMDVIYKKFNACYRGKFPTMMNTTGDEGLFNAFVLASLATSLSSLITTTCCVYINEDIKDKHDSPARQTIVFFVTLVVSVGWSFFMYCIFFWLFGYGKAMVHDMEFASVVSHRCQ
jgi:hypothetical protein